MSENNLPTLAELKKLRKPLRNINVEHQQRLTKLERFALLITRRVGSMGFFIIIFCWTASWFCWNTLGPVDLRFDPFPAFVMWLFISNMIQLFLLPLIMIGQNLESRHSEARAEADFEVNVKAEREIEAILMHLEHQNELVLELVRRLKKE
jgi:uncharacterized membrane protein